MPKLSDPRTTPLLSPETLRERVKRAEFEFHFFGTLLRLREREELYDAAEKRRRAAEGRRRPVAGE
jgi:hypothetical protein